MPVPPPPVCPPPRLPDELFSAILKLNKRRAIRERLERITYRRSWHSRVWLDTFHVVSSHHQWSLGYDVDGQLVTEMVLFRHKLMTVWAQSN